MIELRPKVGDTVWYYFEHAFWDAAQPSLNRNAPHLPPEIVKRWRFTGRTELRARRARINDVELNWRHVSLTPEYDSDDRVLVHFIEGRYAILAPRPVWAFITRYSGTADTRGRIINGVLPCGGTWGFDPLPPIGGGR